MSQGRDRGHGLLQAGAAAALAWWLAGCGPSTDDLVDQLGDPARREAAGQELLLAKDLAVDALLRALEDPRQAAARPHLADVLAGLMMRVDDPRIEQALCRHLLADPDPQVRARIARAAGLYRRAAFAEPLLEAGLADADAGVVLQSLLALEALAPRLSPQQVERRLQAALELIDADSAAVRWEARILVETHAARLVDEGRALELQAQQARAESLYHEALDLVPDSRYASYRLARLHFDAGDREPGLALLRQHGMLLDVPRFAELPAIDGHLDDPAWSRAAAARSFYSFSNAHKAAIPSDLKAEIYLGYTSEALYLGFVGRDEHLDSLVVRTRDEDGDLWWEDIVEVFLDADLDHRSYVHLGVNSLGVTSDAWHLGGLEGDRSWDAGARVAARVGDSAWYLELALPFSRPRLPPPERGAVWGFNFVRTFRGSEYSQWMRTYGGNAHTPDDFGFLLFR